MVAGHATSLAVLGADGRLVPGVSVDLGNGLLVTTDRTGRAFFNAPASVDVLLARISGISAVALVDAAAPQDADEKLAFAPAVQLHEPFSICGGGFAGDADANRVNIGGEPALVLAASPECLAVLAGVKAVPGAADISIRVPDEQPTRQWSAHVALVSLAFVPPDPPLRPGEKGQLFVFAQGVEQPLRIAVGNGAPRVLQFVRGDAQELVTSGGPQNNAAIEVRAIRSGDFSFHARLLSEPDADAARRYLEAAAHLAPKDEEREIEKLAGRLGRAPLQKLRRSLERILAAAPAGDFRALLAAADTSL